jgi:hypothetical protein
MTPNQIFGTTIVAIATIAAFWVYLDATKNKIGEIAGSKESWNFTAGGWAALTLLMWLVGLPAYVIKRQALLDRAQTAPVEVKNRAKGIVFLAFGAAAWVGVSLLLVAAEGLPSCDASEVLQLAESIIQKAPLVSEQGLKIDGIKSPGEIQSESISSRRACRAILRLSEGELPMKYTVEWHNQSRGEIWVQIVE